MPHALRFSTVRIGVANGRPGDEKATMDAGPVELIMLMSAVVTDVEHQLNGDRLGVYAGFDR